MYANAKRIVEHYAFQYNELDSKKEYCQKSIKKTIKEMYKKSEKQIKEALSYFEELIELKEGKVYPKLRVDFKDDEGAGHLSYYNCTPEEAIKKCRKDLDDGKLNAKNAVIGRVYRTHK